MKATVKKKDGMWEVTLPILTYSARFATWNAAIRWALNSVTGAKESNKCR